TGWSQADSGSLTLPAPTGLLPAETTPAQYTATTNAVYSGNVTVCLQYDPGSLVSEEKRLRLLQWDSTLNDWTVIGSTPDTVANTICGVTDHLGTFMLAYLPTCCVDRTGNVNGDPGDVVDVADLTALIDHLFISFAPISCEPEANVSGDPEGTIDIADLTSLIDNLFISFTPTAPCQ
ncbi:MAG: hypothetical protein D6800_03440, partial [Candidatus Zixiibacteriota bacterium]